MAEAAWNPWRALRSANDVTLGFDDAARLTGGAITVALDGGAVIILDPNLDQLSRRAALGHEIIHIERGVITPPASSATMQREEELVTRETARRLVPLDQLRALIDRLVDLGEPVHALDVCEHFGVPLDVAHKAMFLLEQS